MCRRTHWTPVDFDALAVVFDEVAAVARPYEVGGLDVEIARFLLDDRDDHSDELARLAETWAGTPDAHLQIHPLLEEFRVWGGRLPTSATRTVRDRLRHMGLESPLDASVPLDLTAVRATGTRLGLPRRTSSARMQSLRDALAIGGGYVELVDGRHRVLGAIRTRHPRSGIRVSGCRSVVAGIRQPVAVPRRRMVPMLRGRRLRSDRGRRPPDCPSRDRSA